ncbi:predicted protein [Botrytis cinerea T4]|uniref:Uncharacterized protein n=1 Tax=Botryotinia fuckeliana (strain T4) TaxID=999810 RepID=G2XU92_BOTF4|nr:predicted protein [Botrytis cinerea T4]
MTIIHMLKESNRRPTSPLLAAHLKPPEEIFIIQISLLLKY